MVPEKERGKFWLKMAARPGKAARVVVKMDSSGTLVMARKTVGCRLAIRLSRSAGRNTFTYRIWRMPRFWGTLPPPRSLPMTTALQEITVAVV